MRVTLATPFLAIGLLLASSAHAQRPPQEQHAVGARYDAGGRGSAVGAGYMYFRGINEDRMRNGSLVGLGGDVKAYVGAFDQLHAASMLGVARLTAGAAGHGGCRCTTVELALGPLVTSRGTKGVGHLGLYLSIFTFVDVGYSYQFPITLEQPSWLSSHQFSARVHVPIAGETIF